MQSAQTIDARNVGGLRDDMLEILKRHGIDPMGEPPHGADPAERIHKLEQLRDSGLITPAEFDQQRSRILGEA